MLLSINLPCLKPYSFIVCTTTTNRSAKRWNLSRTSLQETWNRLFLSNFLNTLPFNSTNWKKIQYLKGCVLFWLKLVFGGFLLVDVFFGGFFIVFSWFSKYGFLNSTNDKTSKQTTFGNHKRQWKDYQYHKNPAFAKGYKLKKIQ